MHFFNSKSPHVGFELPVVLRLSHNLGTLSFSNFPCLNREKCKRSVKLLVQVQFSLRLACTYITCTCHNGLNLFLKELHVFMPNVYYHTTKVHRGTPPITRFSYTTVFYLTRFFLGQKPR